MLTALTLSRAGSLPQLDGVHLMEIGRLTGRLRWQASSYSWTEFLQVNAIKCGSEPAPGGVPTMGPLELELSDRLA